MKSFGLFAFGVMSIVVAACGGSPDESSESTDEESSDIAAAGMTLTASKPVVDQAAGKVHFHCFGRMAGKEVNVLTFGMGGDADIGAAPLCNKEEDGFGFLNVDCTGTFIGTGGYFAHCGGRYKRNGKWTLTRFIDSPVVR